MSGNVYSSAVHNYFWERPDDAITTFWNSGLDYIKVDRRSENMTLSCQGLRNCEDF